MGAVEAVGASSRIGVEYRGGLTVGVDVGVVILPAGGVVVRVVVETRSGGVVPARVAVVITEYTGKGAGVAIAGIGAAPVRVCFRHKRQPGRGDQEGGEEDSAIHRASPFTET